MVVNKAKLNRPSLALLWFKSEFLILELDRIAVQTKKKNGLSGNFLVRKYNILYNNIEVSKMF